MTNWLAIFDWEWSIVCKYYGEALSVQNHIHTMADGNLPVPSAYDLAARFRFKWSWNHIGGKTQFAKWLVLDLAKGILVAITNPEDIQLCFWWSRQRAELRLKIAEKGQGDSHIWSLLPVIQKLEIDALPQSHLAITDISRFTPNQILDWIDALERSDNRRQHTSQALTREKDKYSGNDSEPVYPWVIEEIEKLKQTGHQLALVHTSERLMSKTQKEVADLFDHHELCGRKGINYKPNPVILRNCIGTIGNSIWIKINELIGNTFYICSGYDDISMALTTQANRSWVGAIHCIYSADDHRLSGIETFENAFLRIINIHPQTVQNEKMPGETIKQVKRRLAVQYCYKNLSFAQQSGLISSAIADLQSRRVNNETIPLEIEQKSN